MSKNVTLIVLAVAISSGACAARHGAGGPVPQPFPRPGSPAPPAPGSPTPGLPGTGGSADGYGIAGTALSFRGVPYAGGGSDPSGFDCSGLVWYVFGQHGVSVPRTVAEQYRAGLSIGTGGLEPGDLVFFNTKGQGPTHVGIAIGGNEFVHAPTSTGVVRVERLGAPYWSSRFIGARRVMPRDAAPSGSTGGHRSQ